MFGVAMAIKLLHTGDLHLGAPFRFLGEKGQKQRQELLATLDRIVELAIEENVDLFLVAGDLFNSNNPSCATIDKVVDTFKKLEQLETPICLIPGSHDSYQPCSIYRLYNFSEALPHLTIFTDQTTHKVFEHLDLTVYGKAVMGSGWLRNGLKKLAPTTKTKYHIGLAHGIINQLQENEREQEVFYTQEIQNSRMNYIALGHYHSFTNCSQENVRAFYCGSPNMLDPDQKHYGRVALVTIQSSEEVNIQPKRVGHSYCKTENIAVDTIENINQISDIISSKAHPHVFLEVQLTGCCSLDLQLDIEALQQELRSNFLKLKIVDNTYVNPEEIPIGTFPKNTVLGQFMNLMQNELDNSSGEERKLNERVLKLGYTSLKDKGLSVDT